MSRKVIGEPEEEGDERSPLENPIPRRRTEPTEPVREPAKEPVREPEPAEV